MMTKNRVLNRVNQCDGCQRGLPRSFEDGLAIHREGAKIYMACDREVYVKDANR